MPVFLCFLILGCVFCVQCSNCFCVQCSNCFCVQCINCFLCAMYTLFFFVFILISCFLCATYIMPLCFLVPCRVFCASTLIISLLCPDSRFFFSSTDTNWWGPGCHTGLGLGPCQVIHLVQVEIHTSMYIVQDTHWNSSWYHLHQQINLIPTQLDQTNNQNFTKCALPPDLLFVSNVVCCSWRSK